MTKLSYTIRLTTEEREQLEAIAAKGTHHAAKSKNALILLNCDKGEGEKQPRTNEAIAEVLQISSRTVERIKKKCVEHGVEVALNGQKSSRIYEKKIDGDLEAHLIALNCSPAPEGFVCWSLRLLAAKMVELKYLDSVSPETVRKVLKKTN